MDTVMVKGPDDKLIKLQVGDWVYANGGEIDVVGKVKAVDNGQIIVKGRGDGERLVFYPDEVTWISYAQAMLVVEHDRGIEAIFT